MELLAEQLEALRAQAAKEGITVEDLVTRIVVEDALDLIEKAVKRHRKPAPCAVVLPFRRGSYRPS